MLKIAIYGKGGIGKSTVTSNLAAAFACLGKKVIQIGCDPKADSTLNLLGGHLLKPVMNYMSEKDAEPESIEDISETGFGGVLCIETGGPTPGLGCAGRGIVATFALLEDLGLFDIYEPDVVLYDVLRHLFVRAMLKTLLSLHRVKRCHFMLPIIFAGLYRILRIAVMLV